MNLVDVRAPVAFGFASAVQIVFGTVLLGIGFVILWGYPAARWSLLLLASALLVGQWLNPRAWLIFVPVVLACVDLGAWSGRLLVNEQDALLAVVAGSAVLAGHYKGACSQLGRRTFWPLWLIALSVVVGLVRGLLPLAPLDANAWNGYLTTWNALRVGKGIVWGLVYWPLLATQMQADRSSTESRLGQGFVVALIGFGAFILWERGFLDDLVTARHLSGLAANWLDFSGSFRIAGPSSQMHLGGEAVDGFLILAWPFALWMVLRVGGWVWLLLALTALGLCVYSVIVTFTRMTYFAFGMSLLVLLAVALVAHWRRCAGRLFALIVVPLLALALLLVAFRFGGSYALVAFLVALLGGMIVGQIARRALSLPLVAAGLAIVSMIGAFLAVWGMLHSKWSDVSLGVALVIAIPSSVALVAGGFAVGRSLFSWRELATLVGCLCLLLPAGVIAVSNYQIHARMATISQDLETRKAHWRKGLSLVREDLLSRILGQGLGTFPLTNLIVASDLKEGTWHFTTDAEGTKLRLLGTGTLALGQRLAPLEPGRYKLTLRARNPSSRDAALTIKVQPRRMLESENWQPLTRQLGYPLKAGNQQWQEFNGHLDLTEASSPPWYQARLPVFVIANQGAEGSAIDISHVRFFNPAGIDVLINGDFAMGGDRWFSFNDFSHLPWHVKNLYLAIYFDLGWLGILAFGLLVLVALWRSLAHALQRHMFRSAVAAGMIGFLAVGAAGTLLDVPPLMTIFLLLSAAGLWRENVHRRGGRMPGRSGREAPSSSSASG